MPPPPRLKQFFCLTSVCLSDVFLSLCRVHRAYGKSRTEKPRKTKIATEVTQFTSLDLGSSPAELLNSSQSHTPSEFSRQQHLYLSTQCLYCPFRRRCNARGLQSPGPARAKCTLLIFPNNPTNLYTVILLEFI